MLLCRAVEWVDVECPGWIRVRLLDADGREWFLIDKVPIFNADFGADIAHACFSSVQLACDIVGQKGDRVVVEPRWRVDAEDGTTQFDVQMDQLLPADD
jgi:hypothetical protein